MREETGGSTHRFPYKEHTPFGMFRKWTDGNPARKSQEDAFFAKDNSFRHVAREDHTDRAASAQLSSGLPYLWPVSTLSRVFCGTSCAKKTAHGNTAHYNIVVSRVS